MRAAGHSFSPGTQQCYCGSAGGRELADLFLHVGSCWLLTEATDASGAVMNEWSLLLRSANRQQLTGMAGRDRTERMTILSAVVLSRHLTGTVTPTVTSRVSSTHRKTSIMKPSKTAMGGAEF